MVLFMQSCTLFSDKGDLLYKQGDYSIYKKNLMSYYNASPDLYVQTANGEIKINLNAFGKRSIPQEKIDDITINEINADSVIIHFTTADSTALIKEESISINITRAIDSIASQKH